MATMPERITATVRAEELPEEILARLKERPFPGARFVVTAEPAEETDEEKLEALRADIAEAVAAVEAGDVYDGEEVFRELEALYGKP